MTPNEILGRAQAARALGEDETFQSVMDDVRNHSISLLFNAGYGNEDLAEAHMYAQAVNIVLSEIQKRIDAGKVTQNSLDRGKT